MSRKTVLLPCAVLAALVLGSGCSSDATGPMNTGALSDADYSSMMDALTAVGAFGVNPATLLSGDRAQVASGAVAQDQRTVTINQTTACRGGGSAQVAGSATFTESANDSSGTYAMTLILTPSACAGTGDNGQVFIFNGNPSITLALTMTVAESGAITLTGRETGGFSWSMGSTTGSCALDVSITESASLSGSGSGSMSGTVCGRAASTTF